MSYKPKSEFLHVMQTRGFLQDCTDMQGLDERLRAGPVAGYIGFDATANSLHVGSLIQIMMLRWLQKTGHRPITLMGGGTTRIGDPSGRDAARRLLTAGMIETNIAGIRQVFAKYLRFGNGDTDALQPDNADWLDGLNYVEFLRDVGRHFTINRMLTFDSVRRRLDREQPLTFLEFNYMLLQAYDFMELNRRYGCVLQLGGSDQWGNIVNGIELTRRVRGAEVFGVTSPLLTLADGAKMGKTASGAVWLNEDRLGAYGFWQFWRNTPDADVGRFLRLFTELPLEECDRLGALEGAEINEAKVILANEATALAHGAGAARAAGRTAQAVFEKGGQGDTLPIVMLDPAEVGTGISVARLLVRTGLARSGKEARRLIADGGARLNNAPITDPVLMLGAADLEGVVKLSAGRKRHALARLARQAA
ncbi:MAG: tyrosine--tRNA ligase [Rhodobacteraceae bacterium]|nr:tyrosine--tRNA ligase [Paracoccaceae bacterium]